MICRVGVFSSFTFTVACMVLEVVGYPDVMLTFAFA